MKKLIFAILMASLLLTACNSGNTNMQDETSADTTDIVDTTQDNVADDTTHDDTYTVWDLGTITVVEESDGVSIFKGDEIISEGEIDELYISEYLGETRLFAKITGQLGSQIHSIDENGISEDFIIANGFFKTYENYIITESNLYDLDKNQICWFDADLASAEMTVNENGIMIEGIDVDGRDTTYIYNKNIDFPVHSDFEIRDGKIIASTVSAVYGKYSGNRAKILITPIDDLPSFGEYKVYNFASISTNFIKDDSVVKSFDAVMDENIVGDCYYINSGEVYNTKLEKISDNRFNLFEPLSDGRYIALNRLMDADEEQKVFIFDAEGNIVFEGNNGYDILHAGEDFILAVDEIDRIVLLTPEFEQLCVFTEKAPSLGFHSGLSGKYDKGGTMGYYFVFEDSADRNEHDDLRSYEYYYIPETGESGCIDNGYSSFAYAKPVLYLYPTEETQVSVKFEHPERLTTVYPKYNNGWQVTAFPDGTLKDENGRSYYALYWEEKSESGYYEFTDGFCVSSGDSAAFLEDKLAKIGFTELEANEFIIYWLPILEQNEYNLIRFELTSEREASNALIISPKPDSLLRMAMHIKGISSPVEIAEQLIPAFERIGFTAVEWGGCIH